MIKSKEKLGSNNPYPSDLLSPKTGLRTLTSEDAKE